MIRGLLLLVAQRLPFGWNIAEMEYTESDEAEGLGYPLVKTEV